MHTHVFENGRIAFVGKGQIFDRKIFVIESLAVFNGRDGGRFREQIENAVTARKCLREIPGQSRHREHGTETAEDGHHADEHCAEVKQFKMHKENADNERDCNKQRYAKFGCRTCFCDAVLHLLCFFEKYIRTAVDFLFPVIFGVVEDNILDTFDTVEEIRIEARKFAAVVDARLFERF